MSNMAQLTVLFARLASQIETGNGETSNNHQPDDVLVAALNQSLNLTQTSRVRVLDTALSLMCFTAPQVFDSVIDCSVNTIVSVLSSSVDCKVLRFEKAEVLRIGGSISTHDCVGVMESCADVLEKLKDHGMLSCSLLYAVIRVAVMGTQFRYTMQLTPVLFVQSTDRISAMSKLVSYIPKKNLLENQELQLRLLLWHLDPQNLVQDVSEVLHDAVQRPFLCLSRELYEKMEWRSMIICWALSPVIFIETRALLHSWFLLTGLVSVLELQVELVSTVLDLLSRPMWWGLSAEVGSKLPVSFAYFLYKHQLFRTLAGPLSCGGFLELVLKIKKYISKIKRGSHPTTEHVETTTSMVDHKSTWAMAMNFPDWFYFASLLLLSGKTFSDSYMSRVDEDNQLQASSCSAAAAWYIAWILDPISESVHGPLAEKLERLSRTLIGRHLGSHEHKKPTGAYEIKREKPKPNDKMRDTSQEYVRQTIQLWLEEFQDVYIFYYGRSTGSPKSHEVQITDNNLMFRRITLGILIGRSGSINEDECELLLHYVATGTILRSMENQYFGLEHRRWNSLWQENHTCIEKCSRKEAVAGACIVFHLTDIAEKLSDSVSETQEIAVDFICQIKLRVVKYLLKCVKRVLHFEIAPNNGVWVKDLHRRILRWRHQGKDVFHGYKDLDDAINVIASKLSYSSS